MCVCMRVCVCVRASVWLCVCVCVCVWLCGCVHGVWCVCVCAHVRENTFIKNMTMWPTCHWNGTLFFDVGPV